MPRTDNLARAEKLIRLHKLYDMTKELAGERTTRIVALFILRNGSKMSTVYEYVKTLKDAGSVVEEGGRLWSVEEYKKVQEDILVSNSELPKADGSLDRFLVPKTNTNT